MKERFNVSLGSLPADESNYTVESGLLLIFVCTRDKICEFG